MHGRQQVTAIINVRVWSELDSLYEVQFIAGGLYLASQVSETVAAVKTNLEFMQKCRIT